MTEEKPQRDPETDYFLKSYAKRLQVSAERQETVVFLPELALPEVREGLDALFGSEAVYEISETTGETSEYDSSTTYVGVGDTVDSTERIEQALGDSAVGHLPDEERRAIAEQSRRLQLFFHDCLSTDPQAIRAVLKENPNMDVEARKYYYRMYLLRVVIDHIIGEYRARGWDTDEAYLPLGFVYGSAAEKTPEGTEIIELKADNVPCPARRLVRPTSDIDVCVPMSIGRVKDSLELRRKLEKARDVLDGTTLYDEVMTGVTESFERHGMQAAHRFANAREFARGTLSMREISDHSLLGLVIYMARRVIGYKFVHEVSYKNVRHPIIDITTPEHNLTKSTLYNPHEFARAVSTDAFSFTDGESRVGFLLGVRFIAGRPIAVGDIVALQHRSAESQKAGPLKPREIFFERLYASYSDIKAVAYSFMRRILAMDDEVIGTNLRDLIHPRLLFLMGSQVLKLDVCTERFAFSRLAAYAEPYNKEHIDYFLHHFLRVLSSIALRIISQDKAARAIKLEEMDLSEIYNLLSLGTRRALAMYLQMLEVMGIHHMWNVLARNLILAGRVEVCQGDLSTRQHYEILAYPETLGEVGIASELLEGSDQLFPSVFTATRDTQSDLPTINILQLLSRPKIDEIEAQVEEHYAEQKQDTRFRQRFASVLLSILHENPYLWNGVADLLQLPGQLRQMLKHTLRISR